jgi:ATP-dependent Clp protease ATP-binding subunit ClpA
MFSDTIKAALERDVVGQPQAVNSVVRGVTRVTSGLMPADCSHSTQPSPWATFAPQLASLFTRPQTPWPNLSIIRIEYLERGPKELCRALASMLETGDVVLPDGRRGSLRNCLLFLTSDLCAREILDEAPRIGFTGTSDDAAEDAGEDRIYEVCHDQAEEHFGGDLMGRLDGMTVFHPLQEMHLQGILERRFARMNSWLGMRAFRSELLPAAQEFLMERGRRNLRTGARDLVRAHQRFVEFPMADLLLSGRIPQGGLVQVDRQDGRESLQFDVSAQPGAPFEPTAGVIHREVPVVWDVGAVH